MVGFGCSFFDRSLSKTGSQLSALSFMDRHWVCRHIRGSSQTQQSSSVASGLYSFPVGFPERVSNAIPPVTGPAAHAPMIAAIRRRPIQSTSLCVLSIVFMRGWFWIWSVISLNSHLRHFMDLGVEVKLR